MSAESWRDRSFRIVDPDARLRVAGNLDSFVTAGGSARTIPNGTQLRVSNIVTRPSGAKGVSIFVEAQALDGTLLGWTSASNLEGKFYSETIGAVPRPASSGQFGSHAAWAGGRYLGQIDLIQIVGTGYEIETISAAVVAPFLAMVAAARAVGRDIRLNSGFRTYAEQRHLRDGYDRKLPGFNLAAKPGFSNHQNGIAVDLDVKPGEGNPNYEWLTREATGFGFLRTVSSETWHWEYRPDA
ncbi:MAG: M15 family metallopeptidase, partial [Sphingomonadales bacterium]